MLLNSAKPYAEDTRMLADEISEKYQVTVMPVNCEQLKREDINHIMENILYEFPLTMIEFYMPKWVEMLPYDHKMKQDIIAQIKNLMSSLSNIRDITSGSFMPESEYKYAYYQEVQAGRHQYVRRQREDPAGCGRFLLL